MERGVLLLSLPLWAVWLLAWWALSSMPLLAVVAQGALVPDRRADEVFGQLGMAGGPAPLPLITEGARALHNPAGLAVDEDGALYVADVQHNRVLRFPQTGNKTADRVWGLADLDDFGRPGTYFSGKIDGLTVDRQGSLYVADVDNNRVLVFDRTVTNGNAATRTYQGAPIPLGLRKPRGVAVDDTGVYIADTENHRVLFFSGASVTTPPVRIYGQDNDSEREENKGATLPTSSSLSFPHGVAVVPGVGLYVADTGNHRVLFFPGTSTDASTVYGQPDFTQGTPNRGGLQPFSNTLRSPRNVVADGFGGLYVSDHDNHRVLFYPSGSTTASRVYGQEDFVSFLPAVTPSSESLESPVGVAFVAGLGFYASSFLGNRVLLYCNGTEKCNYPGISSTTATTAAIETTATTASVALTAQATTASTPLTTSSSAPTTGLSASAGSSTTGASSTTAVSDTVSSVDTGEGGIDVIVVIVIVVAAIICLCAVLVALAFALRRRGENPKNASSSSETGETTSSAGSASLGDRYSDVAPVMEEKGQVVESNYARTPANLEGAAKENPYSKTPANLGEAKKLDRKTSAKYAKTPAHLSDTSSYSKTPPNLIKGSASGTSPSSDPVESHYSKTPSSVVENHNDTVIALASSESD